MRRAKGSKNCIFCGIIRQEKMCWTFNSIKPEEQLYCTVTILSAEEIFIVEKKSQRLYVTLTLSMREMI